MVQVQNNLNFHNTKPIIWLRKENEPKNLTISDFTTKDNFIIVNPEEIGRQIYFEKKNFFCKSIFNPRFFSNFNFMRLCETIQFLYFSET